METGFDQFGAAMNHGDALPSTPDGVQARPNIVCVIPTFNEARFIGSVVVQTRRFADTVIVVDDGSTDATGVIAEAAGAVVVRHERNRGKGASLRTGLQQALSYDPSVIITLDGDGQHVPDEIHRLIRPILDDDADIVVGSRYLDGKSAVPRQRIWGHRVFNLVTNGASGTALTDSQSGFRAFSPASVNLLALRSAGFSVESEMQFLANQHDLRLAEVPITVLYRDPPKRPLWAHGMMVLHGLLVLIGQYRPLLFFGVPGMVVLMLGLISGVVVIDIYRRITMLAVGYALVAVTLIMLGSLSIFAGIILHSVRGLLLQLVGNGAGKDDSDA